MSKIITIHRLGVQRNVRVEDQDYDQLKLYKWYVTGNGYARSSSGIYMHRLLMNTPQGMDTDHINGDRLDNRRINLRVCTHKQNSANSGKYIVNKSGAIGVYWDIVAKRWIANIHLAGKSVHIGSFSSLDCATAARDSVALAARGEYARLNTGGQKLESFLDPFNLIKTYQTPKLAESGYLGVYSTRNKWRVKYKSAGAAVNIGSFNDPHEAAYVYNQIALQLDGDNARLNIL